MSRIRVVGTPCAPEAKLRRSWSSVFPHAAGVASAMFCTAASARPQPCGTGAGGHRGDRSRVADQNHRRGASQGRKELPSFQDLVLCPVARHGAFQDPHPRLPLHDGAPGFLEFLVSPGCAVAQQEDERVLPVVGPVKTAQFIAPDGVGRILEIEDRGAAIGSDVVAVVAVSNEVMRRVGTAAQQCA